MLFFSIHKCIYILEYYHLTFAFSDGPLPSSKKGDLLKFQIYISTRDFEKY
jgi:hypothetical protein